MRLCKAFPFPYYSKYRKMLGHNGRGCLMGEDIDHDDHPIVVIIAIIAAVVSAVVSVLIVLGILGLLGVSGYLV